MDQLFINTDGGSRGNPGPAAIGIVFCDDKDSEIYKCCEYIGTATNNEAEYRAIIQGLKILSKSDWFSKNNHPGNKIICRLDSLLVVEQINGNYKIKQDHLAQFVKEIRGLIADFRAKIVFSYVPREQNKRADQMVNQALDLELKGKK